MKGKKIWLGMLAMALVIGMTAIGCDDDLKDGGGGTDPALNGTWQSTTNTYGYEHIGYELRISNGNWETKYYGQLDEKGTANDGIATKTHIHGNTWTRYLSSIPQYSTLNFESKWYSKNEAQTLFSGVGINLETYYDQYAYSVDGNTLTWGQVYYTRK